LHTAHHQSEFRCLGTEHFSSSLKSRRVL